MQDEKLSILTENKGKCTGCGACMLCCPNGAITMQRDTDGFWYPFINIAKCLKCNKCKSICHMKCNYNSNAIKREIHTYASYAKNDAVMKQSSSGGTFFIIAKAILEKKGVIYGAVQCDGFHVQHKRAESIDEVVPMCKSKYLESSLGDVYRQVKTDLIDARQVLFSGMPCQIAGLLKYLGKYYDNLLTCEIVCHGVPSYRVFLAYIKDLERFRKFRADRVIYRDKREGWSNNHITFYAGDNKILSSRSSSNLLHRGYLDGLYNRPSCNECRYANLPRTGDIILADFWKYSGKLKKQNHDNGISLVTIATENGRQIFESIKDEIEWEEVSLKRAIKSCRHLTNYPVSNSNSKLFNSLLTHTHSFYIAMFCVRWKERFINVYQKIRRQ